MSARYRGHRASGSAGAARVAAGVRVRAALRSTGPLALALAGLAPTARAQVYFEPLHGRPGVRVDVNALADPAAARLLGIPLLESASPLGAERLQVAGARAVLVVLGRFADTPEPDVSAVGVRDRMFTGGAGTRTLADYYEEQSAGAFTVTGDVTEWIQSDVSLLGGAGELDGHGWVGDSLRVHVGRLVAQLDPTLDFGLFDNDGPDGVPNSGDDDGRVDVLSVKFAEVSGHCGGPGPWPHIGPVWVDGQPFASNDSTPAGEPVTVPVYIIDSALECDGVTPSGIGVTAHELGHAIGLPDYYRRPSGPEAEKRHWSVGCFDLMAAGAWGCGDGDPPVEGFGPAGLSAYSRWTLGWAELEEVSIANDQTFVLEPLTTSSHALRVPLSPGSQESWIIEYRTRTGFDAPLPADGVLIYHYDGFRGERATDPALPPPYSFHLVEADGDDALRKQAAEGGNRGVASDVFARTEPSGPLGPATTPSTRDHLGGESTLRIHEIARTDQTATVRLTVGSGFRVVARQMPSSATVLEPFSGVIEVADGQPPYSIAEQLGRLPEGLTLSLEGAELTLAGTPAVAGTFGVSVRIGDASGRVVAEALTLGIQDDPSIDASTVLRAVIGAQMLSPEQLGYLDRSGNGDGLVDLGDLRAYLERRPGG